MPKELFLKKCKWIQSARIAKQNENKSVTNLIEWMLRNVQEEEKCDADNDDKDDDAENLRKKLQMQTVLWEYFVCLVFRTTNTTLALPSSCRLSQFDVSQYKLVLLTI